MKDITAPISVHDLSRIVVELGDHAHGLEHRDIKDQCVQCEEWVTQTMDECECCGVPVVWHNSPTWRADYGSSSAAVRRLSIVPPGPDDKAGALLMDKARHDGFANKTEYQRWTRAVKVIGQDAARESVHRFYGKGLRGRGLIAAAVNSVEAKKRIGVAQQKRQKRKRAKGRVYRGG